MSSQDQHSWRRLALQQSGVLSRQQLAAVDINRWAIAHHVSAERWQQVASDVFVTTTGELTSAQRRWASVLHGGDHALLAGIAAAESAGLERWTRPTTEVLIPYTASMPSPLPGTLYRRSRRDLCAMRERRSDLPRCKIEPAVLMFAAAERSERTAAGLLAASVQQRLTTAELLLEWLDVLRPLRRSKALRTVLAEISGGAQSLGEIDVKRMCRQHGIARPDRQTPRRDSSGRWRFTDCEWKRADGRRLVLEVDGGFHMEIEHWEDDITRQRQLSASDRLIVRCTTGELRDRPESVARDLVNLGVPRRL